MYKLVIVDDEPSVLNGLERYVDWSTYGIELAGTADDGDTGLALIGELKPDIVLTDVKMPAMDGIAMANEICNRFPETKIVFISGHDNVDYLKSALQMHAVDYIFKPISRKELQTVMEQVVKALDEEERERRMKSELQVKLTQSMPLLREKFLMSLIRDRLGPGNVRDRLAFLELPIPLEGPYMVLSITLDNAAQVMGERTERDKQLLSYAALNIIQELIGQELTGVAFENMPGEFVAILTLEEKEEEALLQLAEKIRDNLGKWLKISVTIGVGERADQLSMLPESYKRAREAADQRWYLGKNQVLTMDSLKSDEHGRYRFELEAGERVLSALKAGDGDRLQEEVSGIFGLLLQNKKNGFQYARNAGLEMILLASRALLEQNALTEEWEAREAGAWEAVLQQETVSELHDWLNRYLMEVCAYIAARRSSRPGGVIERIRRFIEANYAHDLSVAQIAEDAYLSPTYASLLYKQETGETLFEYLTKVRIERAKELLRDPRNKFYEISGAVGYSDPSHFSKLFKKVTGLTPSAYREQL